MSVDKFGRRDSAVRVRKETRRSLREDIGLGVTKDGHFDVKNKKIRNLDQPELSNDVVSLQYVNDRCLQYKNDATVDAKDHRIIMLNDPFMSRDAATKRYVDAKSLKKDRAGNVIVDDCRLTRVRAPVDIKDAVNLEFLHANTISLQDTAFYASGRKIMSVANGVDDGDVVTMRQLHELKLHIKFELYKVTQVFHAHTINLIKFVYKYQDDPTQRSVLAEYIEEVRRLISVLDTGTEIKDWRSVYKNARKQT